MKFGIFFKHYFDSFWFFDRRNLIELLPNIFFNPEFQEDWKKIQKFHIFIHIYPQTNLPFFLCTSSLIVPAHAQRTQKNAAVPKLLPAVAWARPLAAPYRSASRWPPPRLPAAGDAPAVAAAAGQSHENIG